MQLIDPKIDLVFKHIFGSSEHPIQLLNLVNAVLETHNEPLLSSIQVLNPSLDLETISDKQVILDIKARSGDIEPINVEIQVVNQHNWESRSLYYWSKMYNQQLQKGQGYHKLKKTISISFLDYNLFERDRCHSLYEISERYDQQRLSDHLQMYFIEIPKLTEEATISPNLRDWLKFLTVSDEADLEPIRNTNPALQEACTMLSKMSSSDEQRQYAEARRKAILDYNTNMHGAREEGIAEGIEKGEQRPLQKQCKQCF